MRNFGLRRSQVKYRAVFDEPAFELLGNPAPLYRQLLRHLGPFGAMIGSLSIDVTTLSKAAVSCRASEDLDANVTVTGLEVFATFTGGQEQTLDRAIRFTQAALAALAEHDTSVGVGAIEIVNHLWGSITGQTFAEFSGPLVASPTGPEFYGLSPAAVTWRDAFALY